LETKKASANEKIRFYSASERDTSNMEASLATAVRIAPTKESPAPVVSTAFTENPVTLPLKFYSQTIYPKT